MCADLTTHNVVATRLNVARKTIRRPTPKGERPDKERTIALRVDEATFQAWQGVADDPRDGTEGNLSQLIRRVMMAHLIARTE
jgi:hypothetical protein